MLNIKISPQATEDIDNIFIYSAETWSVQQAEKYYFGIHNEISRLALNPHFGKDYSTLHSGLFGYAINSHIIFYLILEGDLFVVRVLHQIMDFQKHL